MRTTDRKPKHIPQKKDPYITKKKYKELEETLERLKADRPAAAQEVARLAELGDFSENVEYQLAKRRLRGINTKMLHVENELRQAKIIEPKKGSTTVQLGHTVTVLKDGSMRTYTILGSAETDPTKGIISQNSPIGSALLGRTLGEKIYTEIAGTESELEIVDIT